MNTVILSSGGAFFSEGLTTTAPDGSSYEWTGPTYVLPRETYRALLLSD